MTETTLEGLLARMPAGAADAEAVDDWIDELAEWLLVARHGRVESARNTRLRALSRKLESEGGSGPLGRFLREVWTRTSAVRFLAEAGLPARPSFLGEAWSRVVDRFVPRLDARFDLATLLFRLKLDRRDVEWLGALPEDVRAAFAPLVSISREAIGTAAELVAQRAAGVGLSRPLLRLAGAREEDWPYLELPHVVRDCVEGQADSRGPGGVGGRGARGAPDGLGAWSAWQRCRGRCLEALRSVREALDERGVSTEVLFLLELSEAQLARIDVLLAAYDGSTSLHQLTAALLTASLERRGISGLVHSKVKRLALEVVEHTGHTGEHYVSSTWSDYWQMGRAAAVGGVITAFTAAGKYLLGGLGMPQGLLGLTLAVNYSASFLAIHFSGGLLASKQPAMTAAALARSLDSHAPSVSRVQLIAGISRAQVIAAAGNLLATFPMALLIDAVFALVAGRSVLDPATAAHSLESLHPWRSMSLFFAAVTGALLWMSSMAAGLATNWAAFRSLPEAIRHSAGCRRVLGARGAAALGRFVGAHLGGITGYVALGLLLGFLPAAMGFMGVPLEVRHVTLSGASVALALASQARAGLVEGHALAAALLGVALIGLLNFTVSFALAFGVAVRARDLGGADRRVLRKQVWSAFLRRPVWFLVPPRAGAPAEPERAPRPA